MAGFRIGVLQLLNILGFVVMIIINGLADLLPIGGVTTAEVSAQYANYFVPASITFIIWGFIYLLLLLFCIYQGGTLFQDHKPAISKKEIVASKIGFLFILSCIFNCFWICAWHYHEIGLSVFIMVALLITLILIHTRLSIATAPADEQERSFVWLPFSIYLGWISIATMANIAAWLVSIGWSGGTIDRSWWAIVLIILGTLLSLFMLFRRRNIYFGFALIWGFLGIALRQYQETGQWTLIALTAVLASFVLLILIVMSYRALTKVKTA